MPHQSWWARQLCKANNCSNLNERLLHTCIKCSGFSAENMQRASDTPQGWDISLES